MVFCILCVQTEGIMTAIWLLIVNGCLGDREPATNTLFSGVYHNQRLPQKFQQQYFPVIRNSKIKPIESSSIFNMKSDTENQNILLKSNQINTNYNLDIAYIKWVNENIHKAQLKVPETSKVYTKSQSSVTVDKKGKNGRKTRVFKFTYGDTGLPVLRANNTSKKKRSKMAKSLGHKDKIAYLKKKKKVKKKNKIKIPNLKMKKATMKNQISKRMVDIQSNEVKKLQKKNKSKRSNLKKIHSLNNHITDDIKDKDIKTNAKENIILEMKTIESPTDDQGDTTQCSTKVVTLVTDSQTMDTSMQNAETELMTTTHKPSSVILTSTEQTYQFTMNNKKERSTPGNKTKNYHIGRPSTFGKISNIKTAGNSTKFSMNNIGISDGLESVGFKLAKHGANQQTDINPDQLSNPSELTHDDHLISTTTAKNTVSTSTMSTTKTTKLPKIDINASTVVPPPKPVEYVVQHTCKNTEKYSNHTTSGTSTCKKGWFAIGAECFKVLKNKKHKKKMMSWNSARKTCKRIGGDLAQPKDPRPLTTYLLNNVGAGTYWIGARGDGQQMRWLSGDELPDNDPGWDSGSANLDQREYSRAVCVFLYDHNNPCPFFVGDCSLKSSFVCQIIAH